MKEPVLIFWVTFLLSVCIIGYFQIAVEPRDVDELLDFDKSNDNDLNMEQRDNDKGDSQYQKKVKPNLTLKKLYHDDYNPCEEKLKKYESLNKVIHDYIHRYVNLFLRVSLLKDYYVSSADEILRADVEISMTGEDLAFLQQYSNSSSTAVQRNLSKLDTIMMKIIKIKEKTIMEKSYDWGRTFSENFLSFLNYELLKIIILVLLILIILLLAVKKFSLSSVSLFTVICVAINIMLIFDGWWTYKKKLKEKEVEIYVNELKQKNIHVDCDPSKITWYKAWYNYIFGSDCLTYHLNLIKVATDEVSLYQCVYDTYALYFIQKPFSFFGEAISGFNKHLTDSLPTPFKLLFFIPVSFFTVLIIVFFFLIMCGNRLRISFLGSTFELGKVSSSGQTLPPSTLPQVQSDSRPVRKSSNESLATIAVKGVVSKPRIRIKRVRGVSLEQRPKKLTLRIME